MRLSLIHALLHITTALLVPGPFGPFDVALKILPLTDPSRPDPLDPSGRSPTRRLLLSLFLPVEKHRSCPPITVPYMTAPVAASYGQQAVEYGLSGSLYEQFEMQVCDLARLSTVPGSQRKTYPVILFDPGLSESRLIYNAMARSLASQGYIVVSVDHPFEAPAVEFLDGTVITGIDIDPSNITALQNVLQVRTADVSFIIDQLTNKTLTTPLLSNFPGYPNFHHLALWGHSFGGATSASVLQSDARPLGGLNLDGMLIDPVLSTDTRKPFILAGQLEHAAEDPSWDQFWPHLRGPSMQIGMNNTLHGAYKDILMLLSVVDIPEATRREIQGALGSVDPHLLDRDLNGILTAFFDLLFRCRDGPLRSLARDYEDVFIVRENL